MTKGGKTTSRSFAGTTPSSYRAAKGNADVIRQLRVIGERVEAVKEKARHHFAKYQETWVVKESASIWKQRAGLSANVSFLPLPAKEYTAQSIMTEARRNVRARIITRLTKINSVGSRMSNSVVRNFQTMRVSQTRDSNQSPSRKGPAQ